jgi:hypothetical protein
MARCHWPIPLWLRSSKQSRAILIRWPEENGEGKLTDDRGRSGEAPRWSTARVFPWSWRSAEGCTGCVGVRGCCAFDWWVLLRSSAAAGGGWKAPDDGGSGGDVVDDLLRGKNTRTV